MAFKTKLPEQLTTPEEVNALLLDLHNNGEFFHLDDSPDDISWGHGTDPSPEEVWHLTKLMIQAWDVCEHIKGGLWSLPATDLNMESNRDIDSYDEFEIHSLIMEYPTTSFHFSPPSEKDTYTATFVDGKITKVRPALTTYDIFGKPCEAAKIRLKTFQDNNDRLADMLRQSLVKYIGK